MVEDRRSQVGGDELALQSFCIFLLCSQELEESFMKKELEERRKVLDHDRMVIFVDCLPICFHSFVQ